MINRIFDNIYFIEFSTKNIIYLTTSSYIVHDLNHATDSHRSSPINRSKTSSSEAKYIQHLEQTLLQLDFLYKFLPWFKNQLSPLEQEALSATLFVFIHEQIPRFEPDELNLNPEVLTHYLSNEDVVYNNCMSIPDKAIDIPLWYSEIKKGDSSGIKVRLDRIQIKFTEFLKDYLKNRGSETGN
ncbi:MAG: hypothetical protein K1X29_07625 [Bdellovibrionales bacterium]|nr:hypothetical protein [Bdellovibrionales bacterium]